MFDFEDIELLEDISEYDLDQPLSSTSGKDLLDLISKILPLSQKNNNLKIIKHIEKMIDIDLLTILKNIPLSNKGKRQKEFKTLSSKLVEKYKYKQLGNKAIVGIGGRFSAGKSRFINSILNLEENLLPEDQNPTTSIPTYIIKGLQNSVIGNLGDIDVKLDSISLSMLTHNLYEKYSIGFSRFIKTLMIINQNSPYKNLAFLDTPGYNKADFVKNFDFKLTSSDKLIAYNHLKNIDFLIWLVDIDNGTIKEDDLDFIEKLDISVPILIVMNKIDKKMDRDIESIINVIKQDVLNYNFNIFGITGYSSKEHKEWRNLGIIRKFLVEAEKYSNKKGNIIDEFIDVKKDIKQELERLLELCIEDRNQISNIIVKTEPSTILTGLIDLYGEHLRAIRMIKEGINQLDKTFKRIDEKLIQIYGDEKCEKY